MRYTETLLLPIANEAMLDKIGRGTAAIYIDLGSAWQNGYAESLNGRCRDEFLNTELFATVAEAQGLANR